MGGPFEGISGPNFEQVPEVDLGPEWLRRVLAIPLCKNEMD